MIDRPEVDIHLGSLIIKGIRTPCHTSGHVCYYLSTGGDDGVVFTGNFRLTYLRSFDLFYNGLLSHK